MNYTGFTIHPLKFKAMKKNVGTTDKIIRIFLAAVIAVLFFTETITGILGIVLLILGGILILTSLVGTCPIYLPLKISTRRA